VSARENTIGVVHWEALWAASDGEQISLIIPAFFLTQHTPYLNGVLPSRFEKLFGERPVEFRLDPGDLLESDRGVRYTEGQIVVTGLTEPWPDGAELREMLEQAFREAGEIEGEQRERANALHRHLRETGG
jgi:hypothetical protein